MYWECTNKTCNHPGCKHRGKHKSDIEKGINFCKESCKIYIGHTCKPVKSVKIQSKTGAKEAGE
jgi:hypothetical protein